MDDLAPPSDYTGEPGYYAYGDGDKFRYFDGNAWTGPQVPRRFVAMLGFYPKFLLKLGFKPETVWILWAMFGTAVFVLVLLVLLSVVLSGGGNGGEETTDPTTPTVPADPESTVAPGEDEPSAVSEPEGEEGTVTDPESAGPTSAEVTIDTSGNYRFNWDWGSTNVGFDGPVTGNASQWTYEGTFVTGGSSSWRPEPGSGTVTCSFQGDPVAPLPDDGWPMDCTVSFAGVEKGTWDAAIAGWFEPEISDDGNVESFEYRGNGNGSNRVDPASEINVYLRPCNPPGSVC